MSFFYRAAAVAMVLYSGGALAAIGDDAVQRAAQANFPEFLDLLAIPDVAANPPDIRKNAEFLMKLLEKRGLSAQLVENPAQRPAVFAQSQGKADKTILFYIHFDGQPVLPEQWSQSSPFAPVVKAKGPDGKWQEVPRERLFEASLDPELRIFARSSSDDKGPIAMFLTALDLLHAAGTQPSVGIKLLLDSEEEISSPSLGAEVAANKDLFKADALVIIDGPSHPSGRPTLAFGNRGITQATLTVYGPRAPLHSGHFGNYAPNPAFRLAQLLASMKDDMGRVLVAGYYDGIKLSQSDKAMLRAVPDDPSALLRRIGAAKSEAVGETYQEALQYPSLNIRGMASAAIGAKAANIVPSEAVAELDLRTTPETDGRALFEKLKRHVEAKGYHLLDGEPSEEDRARYDRLARLQLGSVQRAIRSPLDSKIGAWAFRALKKTDPATDPVRIRMMGGTVPTDVLVDALAQPFVLVSLVNADNNQHSYDENLRVGNFLTGTKAILALLTTSYP